MAYYDKYVMEDNTKKNVVFRLISISALLINALLSGLFAYFLFANAKKDPETAYLLNYIAIFATIAFIVFEIIIMLKNVKKELVIGPIAFNNETRTINKPALIFIIVAGSIGLIMVGVATVFSILNLNVKSQSASFILIAVGLFLLINCLIYIFYVICYRPKKFNVKDLLD